MIRDVRLEQADRREWSTLAGSEWLNPEELYEHLRQNTNLFHATEAVPWEQLVPSGASVLDLGCGSGWLTGLLTQRDVGKVIAWDLSRPLLTDVLPAMVEMVGGDLSKVQRVCGAFTPLMLEDASVDVVAMSSAFHHEGDPDSLLSELVRVVKPAGSIVLLNEVPYHVLSTAAKVASTAAAALLSSVTGRSLVAPDGYVAADHVLYDSALGDRAFTLAQWRALFRRHALKSDLIDTGLPSYQGTFRRKFLLEHTLVHFILRRFGA